MFYYFLKGSGNIRIEGKIYNINEGDLVLVNPSELYRCEIYDTAFHERLVLRVNRSIVYNFSDDASALINPFFKREKGYKNHITAKTLKESGLSNMLENIFTLSKSSSSVENVLAVCKTIELLSELKNLIISDENKTEKHENPLINDMLFYINEHFFENISVVTLAKKFNINESYLSHLFKEYVGIPIWNYVIIKRLNFFNELLRKNHTIEQAYTEVGFENYSNFFRLYKKYMNMTPSQFKKELNKKQEL
jgi:YesN/AraC family two-component response regulator